MPRGQVPLPALEAGIGVLLLLALVLTLAGGVAGPETGRAQLDVYAADAGTLLRSEAPRHAGGTRLEEVAASPAAFERERGTLDRRLRAILPANLQYRLVTPHGEVGYPRPTGVTVGRWHTRTGGGPVTLEVWYA